MGIRIHNKLSFMIFLVWYIQSITKLVVDSYDIPAQQQQTRQHTLTIQNGLLLPVHRVPLRYNDNDSPYTFAVTTTTTTTTVNDDTLDDTRLSYNFLATQVWPSSRTASIVIERFFKQLPLNDSISSSSRDNKPFILCEFGCGPGLPSLTALKCNNDIHVIATDIEPIALELVRYAALEQNVSNRLQTQIFSVIIDDSSCSNTATGIPVADLYIVSDIFESGHIAKGAAQLTIRILKENLNCCIWVFAQSDRAQREIYLQEIQNTLQIVPELKWCDTLQPPKLMLIRDNDHCVDTNSSNNLDAVDHPLMKRLWLCNIDEGNVFYG